MKLVRYGAPGREKPGMLDAQGRIRDLSKIVPDIAGDALSPKGLAKLRKLKPDTLPLVRGTPRLGACVGEVGNFVAIGLNYADHAAESGMPLPTEPLIFNKAPSCICGPNDDTMIPKASTKLDYEVELGVVIGSRARYLAKNKAMEAVAGYCLANDVSERVFQLERVGQFTKGKSCETFGPLGPWLVTKDQIRDPQHLDILAHGQRREQAEGTTRNKVFGVPTWSGTARNSSSSSPATSSSLAHRPASAWVSSRSRNTCAPATWCGSASTGSASSSRRW